MKMKHLGFNLLFVYTFQKLNSVLVFLYVGRGIILLQLYPGFSLYRGLYELAQYPLQEKKVGMGWGDLNDNQNGMREVFIIMVIEWFVVLFVAYCIDQVVSSGSGKSPLFFLQRIRKKKLASLRRPSLQRQGSKVSIQMEKSDVSHEVIFLLSL